MLQLYYFLLIRHLAKHFNKTILSLGAFLFFVAWWENLTWNNSLCRSKIDEKQLKTNQAHKNQEQQTNFATDIHTLYYTVKLILLALLLALLSMLLYMKASCI
jgi:hypothetical protein